MGKPNLLNLGCGNRFNSDWVNLDFVSNSEFVKKYNLLKGIPFPNDCFDACYHNNVLEHFSKSQAQSFIKECYRVLKKNGIIRVVVPDLESIVLEYLKNLGAAIRGDKVAAANYDWIMLEMYDQAVRTIGGGDMARYLMKREILNEQYVFDRCGNVVKEIRKNYLTSNTINKRSNLPKEYLKAVRNWVIKFNKETLNKKYYLGKYRMSGEVHQWMYDRFSLKRLLEDNEFTNVETTTPFESKIAKWEQYELDVDNGNIHAPNALYMEGIK